MRTAFINTLVEEAKRDSRIFLLTGDLGYGVIEPFAKELPDRFLNMGVAEQNMVGFAAGLALSGKIPVVYSIATFMTLKTMEQIRNDICYQNLNVKIVGVGSGLTYSQYGATHQSVEDIALMRVLPNMKVICPGDPIEVKKAVSSMFVDSSPYYLRIGAKGEPSFHSPNVNFKIGKGIVAREGKGVALIATGNMLANTVFSADLLKKEGIEPEVISMHTIKPLDEKLLQNVFKNFKYVFTIEEHNLIGGLGSAVSEFLAEQAIRPAVFKRIAVKDEFQKVGGWLDYIRDKNGLSPEKIAKTVKKYIKN